jgi:hypothetical protein
MDINDTVTWDDDTDYFPQTLTVVDTDIYGLNLKVRFVSGRTAWVDAAEVRPL